MAAVNVKKETTQNLFQNMEDFLKGRSNIIFIICMVLTALFGLLLFDTRLSFATDDSTYVLNAISFINRGSYPNFQGALYPFFLALVIKLFGMKILILKTCSFLCILLHNFIFYRAFRGRIPYLILFAGLITFSINAYILAYGSSTFSEAFFLVLQALGFLTFFKLLDKLNSADSSLKNTWKEWLLFGLILFLMSIAKNVAVFIIIGVLAFFLLRKEWKYALLAIVFFGVFKLPYELAVRSKYGNIGGGQTELLLRKDFFDPSKGNVDASDLVDRFYDNFGNYFTVHTFKILGLRESGVPAIWTFDKQKEISYTQDPVTGQREQENQKPSFILALIFIALFVLALWQAFKYNKFIFFMLLYVAVISGITFVALHTFWNQDRLILIYVPLIFMGFCYGLYSIANSRNIAAGRVVLPAFIILAIVLQLRTTLVASSQNSKQFKVYLRGDALGGYPSEVSDYLRVCIWAGENVHDSLSILAYKPVEGAVFAKGRSFSRMPEIKKEQQTPDSLMAILHRKKIGYIISDQFSGGGINQLAQFLKQTKPGQVKDIYKEGEGEGATTLLKLNY